MNLLPYLSRRYYKNKYELKAGMEHLHTIATQLVEWLYFRKEPEEDLLRLATNNHPVMKNEKQWKQELYCDCAKRIMRNASLTSPDGKELF